MSAAGCETGPVTPSKEHRLGVSEKNRLEKNNRTYKEASREYGSNYNMRNFAIVTRHRKTKSRTTELGGGTQNAREGTEMHVRF